MSKPGLDCKNLQGQVHQEVKININSSAHTQVSIKTGKNEGSKSDKVPINGKETDRTQIKKNKIVKRQNLSNRVKFKDDGETYPTLQERNKVRK